MKWRVKDKRENKEDLERGCATRLSGMKTEQGECYGS